MKFEEIIALLEKTGALLEGHFLLSSGLHSNRYVQCAKLLMYPDIAEKVGLALAEKFMESDCCPEITKENMPDIVVSPALGGLIIGQEVARKLGRRHIFVEKPDGKTPSLRRGFSIQSGDRFVVVEDVVTTGKSTKEVLSIINELGGEPVAVLSIIDRTGNKACPFDIPFISLIELEFEIYKPYECPICKEGIPLTKPGSRKTS